MFSVRKCVFLTIALGLVYIVSAALAAEESADKGFALGLQGQELYDAGEYTQAMIAWKKAVEEGEGLAAFKIGDLYFKGAKGIPRDTKNALKWYKKSQDLGYKGANVGIAFMYLNGDSPLKKDVKKAYEAIRAVEDTDNDFILQNAYKFYLEGWGTKVDLDRAREIAQKISDEKVREKALKEIATQETLAHVKKLNTVAITSRGKKYHEVDCQTIKKSHKTLSVTEARRRGYKPCEVCSPPLREWKPEDFEFDVYPGSGKLSDYPPDVKEKRSWVMENIFWDTPWDVDAMVRRFGRYEQYDPSNGNPRIVQMFYFKEIDMTFMVNVMEDKIQTWRSGRADR